MTDDSAATPADQKRPQIGNYTLLHTIGQGTFGKVRLGVHIPTQMEVAIKVIPRDKLPKPKLQEAHCMAVLHHPNITQLFEVMETQHSLLLVMEYVTGGDLLSYLKAHGPMTEREARGAFRQLVPAVHYCHEKGIVHRDLSPSNVLLDDSSNIKIIDFGLGAPYHYKKLRTFCGNSCYAAPELFQGGQYDGPPVDIWSLGILLYKMVTNTVPFQGTGLVQLGKRVLSGEYTVPPHLTPELKTLLTKLLTLKPEDRSSLEDVMPDPWLNMDHEEDLEPYLEPPTGDLDLWVAEQMKNMGIQFQELEEALLRPMHNDVMGTYLLLKYQRDRVNNDVMHFRPYYTPNLSSPSFAGDELLQPEFSSLPEAEQLSQEQEAEEKAQETAGPADSPESTTTPPGSSPKSTTAIPGPSPKSTTTTPGLSPRSTTATPGPSPKSRKPNPQPSAKWTKVAPRHSPKLRTVDTRPSPKMRTDTPTRSPKKTATPRHSPRWRTTAPPPSPELESNTNLPLPSLESRTPSPPLQPELESRAPTSPPSLESQSRTTCPALNLESETRTVTPSPSLKVESRTPSPPLHPELESRAPTSPPSLESQTRTIAPSPSLKVESRTPSPPLHPELESKAPTSPPSLESESRTTCPPLTSESQSRTIPPSPNLASESKTAPPLPSPEPRNTTPGTAPQCDLGDSPSTQKTGSRGRETQEGSSQGRRGLARRCLEFLGKLFCVPCKTGRGKRNKVVPV